MELFRTLFEKRLRTKNASAIEAAPQRPGEDKQWLAYREPHREAKDRRS